LSGQTFSALVSDTARLQFEAQTRVNLDLHLGTLVGKRVELTIREHRNTRSIAQNRWIWGVAYPLIAESIGYDRDEHDELHYWLVRQCFGTHFDERIGADVSNARSSKLNTKEFAEYMEWLVRFAAKKFGVNVPLPDEAVPA
jgi:hypothetical protein